MDIHELITGCRDAVRADDPTRHVMDVLAAFLRQPELHRHLGAGDRSTYEALYRGDDLLVLHVVVPPMPAPVDPHNHRMWAVIGVYRGEERNELFDLVDDSVLECTERFSLTPGDVRALDESTIHAVQPGPDDYLGAVHVYGGDLFSTPRSTWPGGVEQPVDESMLPAFFDVLRRHEDELGRAMTTDEVTTLLATPATS